MLQIDHVYEFLSSSLFKDFRVYTLNKGVLPTTAKTTFNWEDFNVFNLHNIEDKIFLYDQEPIFEYFLFNAIKFVNEIESGGKIKTIITSEPKYQSNNLKLGYYFFHGFAALDWYRGFYALNYNKQVVKQYKHDFISFNRLIAGDRSYRIYFVSKLVEEKLLTNGLVSFGVANNAETNWQEVVADPNNLLSERTRMHTKAHLTDINKIVIDNISVPGYASADIPRSNYHLDIDCFWHIVTETVFYYDKLHLTEKIFKPIVSKQPFMLLAAPGNLAYLKRYGFKTFEGIIDESYDLIQDSDQRIEAVVAQLAWYCSLSTEEKQRVIEAIAPIVEYNFHHFYGEFKHIITRELLDNTKTLFKEIGYDDSNVAYDDIYRVLTN